MNLQEIKKWSVDLPDEWRLEFNELYDIDPVSVKIISDQHDEQLIWEQYFSQDLLQLRNETRGFLLDVGWYPHADICGSYFLKVLKMLGQTTLWDKPFYIFETKSFAALSQEIIRILNQPD